MNKKVPIVIICFLCLFTLIIAIVLKNDDVQEKEINLYVVIDDDSTWLFNDKWNKITKEDVENKKLNVYIDNKYKGNYYLKYGNKWNLFDDNNNFISYEDKMIALSNNVIVANINKVQVNENDIYDINKILNGYYTSDFDVNKIEADLDNNGYLDYIFIVSNLNEEEQNNYFNLVYVKLNGNIQVLINEKIEGKDYYLAPIYNLNYILEVNELNCKNIVINKIYFSEAGSNGNIMYQLIDKNYEIVVED